jgi:hypothetical protein
MLVDYLKTDSGLPIWLVGTSRGTVSATAAAIAFGNDNLSGIVLTSSVVRSKQIGAVLNKISQQFVFLCLCCTMRRTIAKYAVLTRFRQSSMD